MMGYQASRRDRYRRSSHLVRDDRRSVKQIGMKKARHQSVVAGFISAGFGGAVFASSVRLAADEGDGADIATGCAGVLLTGGASGGTGGGNGALTDADTSGLLLLDPLLVADDAEGGEDDGGEDQAADECGAEADSVALEGSAGPDGEECVGCGDDGCDVLLHFWLHFSGAVHLIS